MPEFLPNVLDALRQPLEAGETVIARANHRIAYPSRIQLVAAMNPCKCGGSDARAVVPAGASLCRRLPGAHFRTAARPDRFADRGAGCLRYRSGAAGPEPRAAPRCGAGARGARRQRARFAALGAKGMRTNADCSGSLLEQIAMPDEAGVALLRQASEALQLSARGFHRTLRVARTLADLDGVEKSPRAHIAEALSYRGETLRQQRAA